MSAAVSSSSSESSDTEERVSVMPPTPAGRPGVGGGRSKGDCSVSGHDCLPQPSPLGLGSGERSVPSAYGVAVVLPPLLRVWRKTTAIVPLVWSI